MGRNTFTTDYRPVYRVTFGRKVKYMTSASKAERLAARYPNSAIWERVGREWQRVG